MDDASKLEAIEQEIKHCKDSHDALQNDITELEKVKREQEKKTLDLTIGIERLQKSIEEDKLEKKKQDLNQQEQMNDAMFENDNLLKEQDNIRKKLARIEEERLELEKQFQVSSSMPQKQWVFKGNTEENGKPGVIFDLMPCIRYPIRGGSALITFEDEAVASKILDMKEHVIHLGDCRIKIQAHPLKLQMLETIEILTGVCKNRILVSKIPKNTLADQLLDKLELHFSKQRNSGGEVDEVELLEDSSNVVIKFASEGIAENLTKKEFHQVEFRGVKKNTSVRVSPFISGEIVKITVRDVISKKSVLFTGIPDIMEEETFQDSLEIHFQKPSNGGGEVDAFTYIPEGKSGIACFEADNENEM